MVKAEIVKQLMITVDNKVGTLAQISTVISTAGINMIAICAYAVNSKGFVMFVSEDNKRAMKLLRDKGYDVREEEAVLARIDNKPGALQRIAQKIAEEGVDLNLIYGSGDQKGKVTPIVLASDDNQEVLTIIRMNSV